MKAISQNLAIDAEEKSDPGPLPKVLYVEDEAANRDALSFCLGDVIDLVCAGNATEACEAIQHRACEFSVILMDIQLKGSRLDGVTLTKLFRGKLDRSALKDPFRDAPVIDTPIVFVTAYGENYKSGELEEAGGNMVLAKPFELKRLKSVIADYHSRQEKLPAT